MNLSVSQASLALAPTPAPGQQSTAPGWVSLVPIVLFVVIFYVMLVRVPQRRAKQQENLMKNLKAGDKVVVSGGIIGTIITVKEKTLSIRSADAKFEVLKSAVSEISERAGEPSQAAQQGEPRPLQKN
jgi:preprotein translocase subunit YajC